MLGILKKLLPVICFLASFYSHAQLRADFYAIKTSDCAPFTVQFKDNTTGGTPTSWTWKFMSPSTTPTSALKDPSFIYTSPGNYSVMLTVSNGTQTSSITKTFYITVYDTPKVDFYGTPTIGCVPLTVNFTSTTVAGASGPSTYLWYLGSAASPATSTLSAPSAVYNAGPNSVTLVVTNSNKCHSQKTKNNYINVYPQPGVNFTASPVDFCSSPGSASFIGNASGNGPFTYSWKFGDGGTASGQTPPPYSYTFPPASYSPKLIVTDANGCKDSLTKTNYINYHTPVANFTAPSSVCEGTPVTFNNTSTPAGGTSTWSFGSSSSSPTYTFYTPGTHTITLTYNYKGCIATTSKTITVNPKPVANFTINPDTLCPAPAYVQFIPNFTYSSYWWDFGVTPAVTNTSASPTFLYTQNGFYTPTLVVANNFGCLDTVTKLDYVKLYDLSFDALPPLSSGCKPLLVQFTSSLITHTPDNSPHPYPYPAISYDWDFGDGSPHGTTFNPSHIYTDTGVFNVVAKVIVKPGCTRTKTVQVKVGLKPNADFSAAPTHVCINGVVQFTDLSTGPKNEWFWTFGDGGQATSQNPFYTYSNSPGIFTVTLLVSHNGCSDTISKMQYITVDSPKAIIDSKPSCDTPTKIYFKNKSLGATSFIWFFGDPSGTTSTVMDPVFQYPSTGTYTVKLATYNSRSGCRDTLIYPINIINPYVTITTADTTICKGDSIAFTGSLIGRPPTLYTWYINSVLTAVKAFDPVYGKYFNTTGYQTVKLTITDNIGCNYSLTKNNYVLVSKPNVQFSASPTIGCTPLTVVFTDNTTVPTGANIARRFWKYSSGSGDTSVVTGSNHSKVYYAPGVYDVKLIVLDDIGCKDSLIKAAYITANKPHADFVVKDTACIDELLTFSNQSSGGIVSADWDFGDGGQSTAMSPKHAYSSTGSYTIRLIMTDSTGCKDTLTKVAGVNIVKPTAAFTLSDSVAVCPPLYVKFTNNSINAFSNNWDLGNSNVSTFTNPTCLYTQPGLYNVVLKITNRFGCVDSVIKKVNIYGYAGAFTYTPLEGCAPLQVVFTATTTNVAGMEWDFSDGTVVTQLTNTISHTYNTPGAYIPKLVVNDISGCKALSPGLDTIKVDGVIANYIADAPCQNSNVTLLDTSTWFFSNIIKWKWTFHDGSSSNIKNPIHYYGPPGTYPVKLYVENSRGCKDSITKDLIIHRPPNILAGADTVICLRDSTQLHASGGISYVWKTTPYLSCLNCADPFAKPTEPFNFIVTGKDSFNCVNTDTIRVSIKTKVTATTAPDGEICDLQTLQLSAKGANTYSWTPTETLDNPNSATPIASPHTTTTYRLVSFEGSCIPDTDMVKLTVYPLPDVRATGTATIIAGNSTNIQATGNLISRFKWEPAQYLSCDDCPDPTASPLKTTVYLVKVYTDHGCVDSDKVTIKVLCDKSQLFLPNTFTPNGDGQNDVFYPRGVGIDNVKSFRIFNRWGEKVFEKMNMPLNDESQAWDGKLNGTLLPPDVFVYIVEANCEDGQTLTIKGDITLVR